MIAHRPGALERAQLLLEDWQHAGQRPADTEARMLAVLYLLQLAALVASIRAALALLNAFACSPFQRLA